MYQDDSVPAARKFIFSDEFYDEIEKQTAPAVEPTNAASADNLIPNPSVEVQNIISNNNTIPTQPEESNPNDFFKKSFNETTTVYDSVGNTISKTVSDGENVQTLVEKPTESIFEYDHGSKPDLGIPRKEDIIIPDNIEKTDSLVDVPTIKNDINLNVETGVDTKLEAELKNNKQEYVPTINFFDIDPLALKEEVPKYRATRKISNPIKLDDSNVSLQNNTQESISPSFENERIVIEEPIDLTLTQSKVDMDTNWVPENQPLPVEIEEDVAYEKEEETVVVKSDLLDKLSKKEQETGKISILARYGDDFCSRDYITNPAIGRDREIKELEIVLLTPEKSAILVGKPGIGKTSIVEGLAYQIQRNNVPDVLKGYTIVSVKTTSLLGNNTNGETRLQTLIDELKELDKIILFIDEVHMLMGATNESSLDFANMFKESLGRGSIKMIGATTSDEYERYVLRDKAFVRRFQRVDVNEPTRDETIQILMGTLPKIEKTTGAKLKYTYFIKTEIMSFITDITTEYKRVYGIGSRYPDICITLLNQAFSEAVFNNRNEVNIFDIRNAIQNSKNIYPDVIRKELVNFDAKFKNVIEEEKNNN